MRTFWTLALVGVAMAVIAAAPAAAPYKVGDTVKDFALKDTTGKTVRLSQFQGKVIVIAFSATY